jgi:hypothetical protein
MNIQNEYGSEAFISGLSEVLSELLTDTFNIDDFDNIMSIFINLPTARYTNENDDLEKILLNTAEKNGIYLHERILINHLLKLCVNDKIVEQDTTYFLLLDQFFTYVNSAYTYLATWEELSIIDDTVIKGVALSKSKTPKQILKARLKEIENALKLVPSDNTLIFLKEVIEKFIASPYEINAIVFGTYLLNFDKHNDLNPEKIKALDGIRTLLNSASPVEKHHIYNSVKRFMQILFYKDNYWQKVIKNTTQLSNESLANIIDVVMQYGFDIESKTSPDEMNRTIQTRTYFFDFPIFELETITNKKSNPFFEDNEELFELLEKLQGKFPLISPVPTISKQI